jgi:hypothetical protein
LDNSGAFLKPEGQRLLYVNVLAGVHRVDGHHRVPVVRHGDQNDVNVCPCDKPSVIVELNRPWVCLSGATEFLSEYIAERRDLNVGELPKYLHQIHASVAAAD